MIGIANSPFSIRFNGGGSVSMRPECAFGHDRSWPYYVVDAQHEVPTRNGHIKKAGESTKSNTHVTLMHVVACLCRCSSVEASPCLIRRPHTTDGNLLDQDGYNSTTTTATLLHLMLQDCKHPALVALSHLLLSALARDSSHLAVAPPLPANLLAEQQTLLPHFVHPLGSPLVY